MSDLTYPSTVSATPPSHQGAAAADTKVAGNRALFWSALLLLSLSYELPLYELTAYDRLNPRLFDVVLILATLFSGWRLRIKDSFVGSWLAVTVSFFAIGLLSFVFLLPEDYRYYSLFYGIKYLQVFLFLLVISGLDWTRQQIVTLLKCFAIGVALAGVWGLLQKLGILPSERYLPNGAEINLSKGAILATFGTTYFHSGVMGAMGATVALALRMSNRASWLWFLPVFGLSAFLAVFAGSRAGMALLGFAVSLILFRKSLYLVAAVILVSIVFLLPGVLDYLVSESITIQRILDTEQANSVQNRISGALGVIGEISRLIDYHGIGIFLYGGGFYAVPMPDAYGLVKYRVGYGIHNIHIFPFEQAGILGALSCLAFWAAATLKGWRARTTIIGASGLALLLGIAVVGWAGQIFFLGFGTENMLAAQLGVLFLLFLYSSAPDDTATKAGDELGRTKSTPSAPLAATGAERSVTASGTTAGEERSENPAAAAPASAEPTSPLARFLEK